MDDVQHLQHLAAADLQLQTVQAGDHSFYHLGLCLARGYIIGVGEGQSVVLGLFQHVQVHIFEEDALVDGVPQATVLDDEVRSISVKEKIVPFWVGRFDLQNYFVVCVGIVGVDVSGIKFRFQHHIIIAYLSLQSK